MSDEFQTHSVAFMASYVKYVDGCELMSYADLLS